MGTFQVRIGKTQADAFLGSANGGTDGVDYIELPISSTYKTTSSNIVDSSRNAEAIVIATVIRAGIRKIEMTWRVISCANFSKMAKFFNIKENFMFYAYYFDQDDNGWASSQDDVRKFYVGDRVADALQNEQWTQNTGVGGGIAPKHIENFKLSLIEV